MAEATLILDDQELEYIRQSAAAGEYVSVFTIGRLCKGYSALRAERDEARRERDDLAGQLEIAQFQLFAMRETYKLGEREQEKLQAFKDWVHTYLDAHGVPHHPPGIHGAEGCRIGDRLDWLLARAEALEAALRDAERAVMRFQGTGDRAWSKCLACGRERQSSEVGVPRHNEICPFRVLAGREPAGESNAQT